MTDRNNRSKSLCLAAVLCAAFLSGCTEQNETQESVDALPDVTAFSSEASVLREEGLPEETDTQESKTTESETETSEEETAKDTTAETTAADTTVEEETTTAEETVTEAQTTEVQTTASRQTEVVTDCSVPMAAEPLARSTDYDKDFFEDDLFIGDSISTGYSLYGFFPDRNVFAKVGLNPSTVLTKNVSTCYGEISIGDMISYTMPKRAYIMLGSNGIQWLSIDNMIKCTQTLIDTIHSVCEDTEIVIIGVTPVTPGYDSTVPDVNVMDKINVYNASLSKLCRDNGMLFVDSGAVLKNSEGYFDTAYAEKDGLHFKASAYKVLLSKIESDVREFEGTAAAEIPEETEPAVTTAPLSEEEAQSISESEEESRREEYEQMMSDYEKMMEDYDKMSDAARERLLGEGSGDDE